MHDSRNLSGKLSDGYERLYPSISASLSNVLISSNSAMVISLLMLTYFTLSVSGKVKRGLLSMISDSSLGGQIIKLKIDPSFGQIAFFTRMCSSVFSLYLGDPSIRKENDHLFAILSTIPLSCNPAGSFLRTSSVNIAT